MVVGGLGGGEIVTWNEEGKDRVTCASRTLGEQSVWMLMSLKMTEGEDVEKDKTMWVPLSTINKGGRLEG